MKSEKLIRLAVIQSEMFKTSRNITKIQEKLLDDNNTKLKIKGEYYTYQDIQDMYGIGMITRAKFDAYCTRLRKLEEDNHSQKIRIQMYRDLYHILYDLREKFREEVREENEHN